MEKGYLFDTGFPYSNSLYSHLVLRDSNHAPTEADAFCESLSHKTDFEDAFDWTCGGISTAILLILVVGMSIMLKSVHFKV